jgi:ribosomal protein L37AE/L43A
MPDESATATIVCPTCHHTTERGLGWLRTVPVWDCPFCGAALEIDQKRLAGYVADETAQGAGFTATLSPRPNRGITTRRTR